MAKVRHRYTGTDYDIVVDDMRVKHKDYFSMKNTYIMVHEWLVQERWGTRSDPDFPETLYLHRFTQTAGQEMWIWWRLQKIPQGNSYYRWDLDIDWHIIGMKDENIMVEGKKYKANFGEPEFKVYAKIIADYQGTWKKHWFLKHVSSMFRKRLFHKDIKMHRRELYREVYRLREAIKIYFQLQTYLPETEGQKFLHQKDFT